MSIERALVVSSWPDCSGFPASGPYAKKKALPTDDDALVRAARHSLRLRKICHEQNNILSSFFLSFFLFSFSGWIFRSGSGGTRWSYGIYIYITFSVICVHKILCFCLKRCIEIFKKKS